MRTLFEPLKPSGRSGFRDSARTEKRTRTWIAFQKGGLTSRELALARQGYHRDLPALRLSGRTQRNCAIACPPQGTSGKGLTSFSTIYLFPTSSL